MNLWKSFGLIELAIENRVDFSQIKKYQSPQLPGLTFRKSNRKYDCIPSIPGAMFLWNFNSIIQEFRGSRMWKLRICGQIQKKNRDLSYGIEGNWIAGVGRRDWEMHAISFVDVDRGVIYLWSEPIPSVLCIWQIQYFVHSSAELDMNFWKCTMEGNKITG